ncbi:hypothetical protein NADE_000687 [Nannochloris sp. 'desiccata']|nr:hypothetical protein KSW81_004558 [Chlorella desiccata (nom. nud.)]KAH7618495.1 hypothetical protein NADE_000686 [Chlorella desiccata (nom. nud.)]KAH7618496.1 hypothetical protein NADE_000687 [Chlorella desiccata (nom. nud.)]
MDVAADESQTHSQFITESMASNRDELRVAALKELQQRALDKWVAQNGTSAGVQNYKLYKSISQELAETEQGLDGGYLYPMLRGPARGKHLVLEDLPNAGGFRVDPNMDTISAVFPSLLQLRNLTVAPPRIIKASPVLDSKIKIARRLRPDSNVYTYCKSSGANEYSGKGIFRRMGPHTLIGSVATEAGGTVPVYMCSAWAGPMDAGGSISCGGKAALPAHGFNLPHAAAIPGLITSSLLILLQPGLQTGHGAVITGHVAIVDV